MVKKLLKYDLKYIYKALIVLYALSIIFSFLTRILWMCEGSAILHFMGYISNIIMISCLFSVVINNLMKVWTRFVTNIYKDESYLTHTLPVSKKAIYASKFISALISMASSILVIIIAVAIAYYSKENLTLLKEALERLATAYDSTVIGIFLVVFAIFFLEMMAIVLAGFTGILISHRSNEAKMVKSIVIGFLFFMGISLVLLGGIFVAGFFAKDIMYVFLTNTVPNIQVIKTLLTLALTFYTLVIIFYYFLDIHVFQKGVNVD